MCFSFYLQLDGECDQDLGTVPCHLSGCGLRADFFQSLVDDVTNADVRVASARMEPYSEFVYTKSRWPSAPLVCKALGRVSKELDDFAERCSCFSEGVVRLKMYAH